ncbi:MAG TPA: ATP-binding cassette domain-containing protein [Bacteroidia bacterium]|nr:ATP-binding cassette domain-containing protein [Bacteroidia bacterium]
MIRLENITKIFNKGEANEVSALKNISFEAGAQEFVVLVGGNGSGKSTLLNIISGKIISDAGKIFLDNKDVTNLKEHERSKWIARIFQDPLIGTAPDLSILENFRLAWLRTQKKKFTIGTGKIFQDEVKEKISMLGLGLENNLVRPMSSLSGGQRQALTLVMAVMAEARIILLDEPASALDPKTAALVMQSAEKIIREFNLTAILVTHNLKDALTHGDRIIQMDDGVIIRDISGKEKTALNAGEVVEWFG